MDIGQTKIAALEAIRQSGVIDPEQMQDRGIQIVNMHGVLGDIVAVFIGLTDHMATSHPGTGNQGGKASGVVVSTVVVGRQSSLRINGSTELTSPNDECIVEELWSAGRYLGTGV